MARRLMVLALCGCSDGEWGAIRDDGRPPCSFGIEVVDATTGAIEVVRHEQDCAMLEVPDMVTYQLLLDEQWEPLYEQNPVQLCNTASQEVLALTALRFDELSLDPTTDRPGTVVYDDPEGFVDGAWMRASYAVRQGSGSLSYATWNATFALGVPDSAFSCASLPFR